MPNRTLWVAGEMNLGLPLVDRLFTADGDPAAEDFVSGELTRMVDVIARGRDVRAVVLGGSFGRGEGKVLHRDGRYFAVNDYDLWIIMDPHEPEPDVEKLIARLGDITDSTQIDLAILRSSDLPVLPPYLIYYDLKYGGRILTGDGGVLGAMPNWAARDIPRWEAVRLLSNRLAGFFTGVRLDTCLDGGELELYEEVQLRHLLSASIVALLLLTSKYDHLERERLRALMVMGEQGPEDIARRLLVLHSCFSENFRGQISGEEMHRIILLTRDILEFAFRKLVGRSDCWAAPEDVIGSLVRYRAYMQRKWCQLVLQWIIMATKHGKRPRHWSLRSFGLRAAMDIALVAGFLSLPSLFPDRKMLLCSAGAAGLRLDVYPGGNFFRQWQELVTALTDRWIRLYKPGKRIK